MPASETTTPEPGNPHGATCRCLVVLPTYNERENLTTMVEAIGEHFETDILIVDDNSPDGTGELAGELARQHRHVFVLHREAKGGLGTAYVAGFRWGLGRGYERILEMDCDFSHDPADLPRLVEAVDRSAADRGAVDRVDLSIGSRYVPGGSTPGWSWSRRLISRAGNLYARVFLGTSVRDWTAGFRCYRADALRLVDLDRVKANGYAFQILMAWAIQRSGGTIGEIPIRFTDRRLGTSKMNKAIVWEALRLVPMLRFSHRSETAPVERGDDAEKTVIFEPHVPRPGASTANHRESIETSEPARPRGD